MQSYELEDLGQEFDVLINFFSEIIANEDELLILGLHSVITWETYKKAKGFFSSFDSRMFELMQFSRRIDPEIGKAISEIVENSSIEDSIGKFSLTLRIEEKRTAPKLLIRQFFYGIRFFPYLGSIIKHKHLLDDKTISVSSLVVALNRLLSLTKRLQRAYYDKISYDDDFFKPSNINVDTVLVSIETAIVNVKEDISLPAKQVEDLLTYLNAIKAELTKDQPAWNKVIGALMITATILSGVAESPKAYENINTAIKYILGGSVERHLPIIAPSWKVLPLKQPPISGSVMI